MLDCHTPPFYLDNKMHDLHVERFVNAPPDGPIKTFTLRGIKDSPPYLHDGRLLTLEDTVEFFNLVLELKLTKQERRIWSHSCVNCNAAHVVRPSAYSGKRGGQREGRGRHSVEVQAAPCPSATTKSRCPAPSRLT